MGGVDGEVRMGRCGGEVWRGGAEVRMGVRMPPQASPISHLLDMAEGSIGCFHLGGVRGVCAGAELGVGAAAKQETAPLFSFG